MRALLFGAGGQLGRALERTQPATVELTCLDRAACDVTDAAAVGGALDRCPADLVLNAAAYTQVDAAESDPDGATRTNAEAPGVIARACAARGVRLVHVSTDYVFDGTGNVPYRPDAETRPLGVYGLSKRRGELAVLQALGAGALVVRTSWLYAAQGRNFVTRMLELMAERPELRVVVDQVGAPTAADELALALWRLAERRTSGVHHWCNSGVASWYDFAVAIGEEAVGAGLLPAAPPIRPIRSADYPTPAARPHYSVLDKESAEHELGEVAPHWRVALRTVLARRAELLGVQR